MLSDREREMAVLAATYGSPVRHLALLPHAHFEPVCMADRVGEVCIVIRRPNGRLLTAIKTTYPPDAYRLLTGGIGHGESVWSALHRETAEETGLEIKVRRFLAVVEYRTADLAQPVFVTVAFLLDEVGGTLACADPNEQHADFLEIEVSDLPARAALLENLDPHYPSPDDADWAAWGHFRAIIHCVVYNCLQAIP